MVADRLRRPAAALLLLVFSGCATNPVTQKPQFMVVSEQKEIRVGEETSKEIKKEFGYYDDLPGLNDYLNTVGERLVAQSDRKSLVYHFQALNTPVINAFALPGGYVYVTRGLLARLNSEDELASVLGHELTHVAARHTAAMLSKAYAAQTAIVLASLFYPQAALALGDLVNIALGLAFLGYSRAMEAQADEYGLTYMEKAGYNPAATAQTFRMFLDLQEREPGKMEHFLLSHPPTKERLAYAEERLRKDSAATPALVATPLRRDDYLRRVEGLMLGQADGEKVVVGNVFYHKHYGASFTFPDAYAARLNPPDGEIALFRDQKEGEGEKAKSHRMVLGFEANALHHPGQTIEEYIQGYLKGVKMHTTVRGTETIQTKEGLDLTVKTLTFNSSQGTVRCLAAFYLKGKNAFVLYGYTLERFYDANRPEFLGVIQSLRFPPAEEILAAQPSRLRLLTLTEGESWESVAEREMGGRELAPKLAAYNGFFDAKVLPVAGTLVKIPSRQALVSKEN